MNELFFIVSIYNFCFGFISVWLLMRLAIRSSFHRSPHLGGYQCRKSLLIFNAGGIFNFDAHDQVTDFFSRESVMDLADGHPTFIHPQHTLLLIYLWLK